MIFFYRALLLKIFFKKEGGGVSLYFTRPMQWIYIITTLIWTKAHSSIYHPVSSPLPSITHIFTLNSRYLGFLSRFCADPQSKPWHDHFSVIRSHSIMEHQKMQNGVIYKNWNEWPIPRRSCVKAIWHHRPFMIFKSHDLFWISSFFNISFI